MRARRVKVTITASTFHLAYAITLARAVAATARRRLARSRRSLRWRSGRGGRRTRHRPRRWRRHCRCALPLHVRLCLGLRPRGRRFHRPARAATLCERLRRRLGWRHRCRRTGCGIIASPETTLARAILLAVTPIASAPVAPPAWRRRARDHARLAPEARLGRLRHGGRRRRDRSRLGLHAWRRLSGTALPVAAPAVIAVAPAIRSAIAIVVAAFAAVVGPIAPITPIKAARIVLIALAPAARDRRLGAGRALPVRRRGDPRFVPDHDFAALPETVLRHHGQAALAVIVRAVTAAVAAPIALAVVRVQVPKCLSDKR